MWRALRKNVFNPSSSSIEIKFKELKDTAQCVQVHTHTCSAVVGGVTSRTTQIDLVVGVNLEFASSSRSNNNNNVGEKCVQLFK